MKCKVCGKEIIENKAKCPVCGFPVLQVPANEDTKEAQEKILKLAEEYKLRKLQDMKIGLVIYKQNNEKGKQNERLVIDLAEFPKMKVKESIWNDTKFARTDRKEPMVLELQIQKGKNPPSILQTSVEGPSSTGFWNVGLLLLEDLKLEILLRDDKDEKHSAPVSLAEFLK